MGKINHHQRNSSVEDIQFKLALAFLVCMALGVAIVVISVGFNVESKLPVAISGLFWIAGFILLHWGGSYTDRFMMD